MNTKDKIWCGFGKYAFSEGDHGQLVIQLAREPIYVEINLEDLSTNDCKKLSEFFNQMYEDCVKPQKLNNLKNELEKIQKEITELERE